MSMTNRAFAWSQMSRQDLLDIKTIVSYNCLLEKRDQIMKQEDKSDSTKERILNEAEALFAEKGYHAVSVREITAAAECNLAAMNYHFGHKQDLYLEVFRARWVPRAKRMQACFRASLPNQAPPS
jgi:AcrR family transcriptional regulator